MKSSAAVQSYPARIEALDVFRGLAALSVVIYHYGKAFAGAPGVSSDDLSMAAILAHVFFVISGFVIYLPLSRARSATDFIIGRIARLFPAYWVAVVVIFVLIGTREVASPGLTIPQVAANLTMLQEWLCAPQIDSAYWALAPELAFYAIITLLFRAGWLGRIEALALPWLGIELAWNWAKPHLNLPSILGTTFLLQHAHLFVAGMIFCRIRTDGVTERRAWLLAACLVLEHVLSGMVAGFAALIYFPLILMVGWDQLGWICVRPLLFLGSISYSLFLLHQSVGQIVIRAAVAAGAGKAASIALAVGASLGAASLLTFVVERPLRLVIRGAWQRWAGSRGTWPATALETSKS